MHEHLVKIDFKAIEKAVAKEESRPVFEYVDGKKTDKVKGYRQSFMIFDDTSKLNMKDFSVRFENDPNFSVGTKVKIEYDVNESKIYASTRKDSNFANIQLSLVAKNAMEDKTHV